jgi:nucleoside phosphorylase
MSTQQSTAASQPSGPVDLAIITAMQEELEPVLNLLGGRQQWQTRDLDGFRHFQAQFPCGPRPWSVIAGSLWKYGGNSTAAEVLRLKPLQPRLIVMTGICAGREEKDIQLGDVIVAERAFLAGEGKKTAEGFLADIRTFQPSPELMLLLKDFAHNRQWAASLTTPRPRSLRYQAEWLLCQLATQGGAFPANDADWASIRQECPNYTHVRTLLLEQKLLGSTGKPTAQARKVLDNLRERHYGQLMPIPDREQPAVHYYAYASTEAVVSVARPFQDWAAQVRNVGAIDLEVAALYAAAAEIRAPVFAVKGVSDYGTPTKDDAFHAYAAEAAARWMYAFVCDNARELDEQLPKHTTRSANAAPAPQHTGSNVAIGGNVGTSQVVTVNGGAIQGSIIGSQTNYGGQPGARQPAASASQEEIDKQLELLNTHRRTLMNYLTRLARLSSAHAPPEIDHGIREARDGIRRCKAALRSWGVRVDDHPDDEHAAT